MAMKLWETLNLQDAELYIEENPAGAARLKKRLRDTIRKRMKTLEKHGMAATEGYRWMEIAMRESLGMVSAYSLSRMTNILGSKRTSYTGITEMRKKAVETINLEFGEWVENPKTGEQILRKPFLESADDVEGFFDLMHWYKENVVGFAYSKQQKAQIENVWATMKSRGESWKEVKTYLETQKEMYYDGGEEPDIDEIIKSYLKEG